MSLVIVQIDGLLGRIHGVRHMLVVMIKAGVFCVCVCVCWFWSKRGLFDSKCVEAVCYSQAKPQFDCYQPKGVAKRADIVVYVVVVDVVDGVYAVVHNPSHHAHKYAHISNATH